MKFTFEFEPCEALDSSGQLIECLCGQPVSFILFAFDGEVEHKFKYCSECATKLQKKLELMIDNELTLHILEVIKNDT